MKTYRNTPSPPSAKFPRQPLLWAALAFAAGIVLGANLWRPPVWWLITGGTFAAASSYFLRRRVWAAAALALGAMVAAGAFQAEFRRLPDEINTEILRFAEGPEVVVTAHVLREDLRPSETMGGFRQALDLETEEIECAGLRFPVRSGIRVSFYSKDAPDEDEDAVPAPYHAFRYGARLRFPAKLYPPRNFRNPGAFDYRGYLEDRGIAALGSAKAGNVEVLPGFSGSRLELARTRIRRAIIEKIHALWPPDQAALVDAMVVGEEAFLGRDTRTEFQRSGTYHVLVVSGMNVGILAFVVFWVLRKFHVSDLVSGTLTVILAVAYAFLTDVGAPIWRATLMLILYLGVRYLYRERSMLNAIGVAALGLLITDPNALFGASFQLTFLCVLLIAAVGVPLLEKSSQPYLDGLRNLESVNFDWTLPPRVAQFRLDLRAVAMPLSRLLGPKASFFLVGGTVKTALATLELLLISAVMQIGLALPMAYYFHRATVVGLPANLLVVPLTGVLMPAAVLAVALGFVWLPAAWLPVLITGLALQGISGTVRWLGGMRMADVRIPTPESAVIVLGFAGLAASMLLARRRWALAFAGVAALAFSALALSLFPATPKFRAGVLEVTAIDVGQGDSLLVVSPDGRSLLVDGGGTRAWMQSGFDVGENVVSPYLWSRGISRIDAVALSHPHADHMGGLPAVIRNFKPRELWIGEESSSEGFQSLLKTAQEARVSVVRRASGDAFSFGATRVRVLAPQAGAQPRASRENDDSLAMKLTFGNTSALLEGDAERPTEKRVAGEQPQADLLKVAHHGSATSTAPEFLSAVHPSYAVISVGARNGYGHPRREVLERLAAAGVGTYRTDLDGAVTFYLDGRTVSPQLPDQK